MCRFFRFAAITLGFACLLVASTQGQDTPKAQPQPFNPLGDPARFSRLGGWGGFGGMIGQFGLAKAMLVTNSAIHEELKVTKEQKEELKGWEAEMRKKGETMFRGGGANPTQPGEAPNNGGPPGGPGGFNPLGMLDMITNLVQEGETSLAKILTKKQYTRLNQIALQMEGVTALGREDVAEAVNLGPDQSETIHQILGENKTSQIGFMMGQALAMRGRRGQPDEQAAAPADAEKAQSKAPARGRRGQAQTKAAPTAEKPAETKKAAAPVDDEDPDAQAKRRAANRERMEGQFTKMRNGTDEIQNATTVKILKVLTKKQRERFDKLLGPPFDPSKFTFPGMPARNPAVADPANSAAKKAEAPVSNRSTRLRDARGSSKPDDQ